MKAAIKGFGVVLAALLVVAVMAVAAGVYMNPPDLIMQGEVEATQVQVAAKIVGRINTLRVREGDRVHKGELIATLDSPEIQAKLRQAEAARTVALAQKEKADSGAREEEVRAARNVWLRAKAAADLAQKTYERVHRLHGDGIVPTQKLDEAEGQRDAAQRAADAAKATYQMAAAGARKEDVKAAEALADQASGVVAEVDAYLDETHIVAPLDGEIADIIPEQGELTSPGFPVALILDLSDMWVTFNIREDLLPGIGVGTVFDARFPALGNTRIKLRVNYMADLGDFAVWRATKATGDFDLKTFEVRAVPMVPISGLRPGMSALVDWPKPAAIDLRATR